MEPQLDRGGLEVLSFEECTRLLAAQPVGRVAFMDAGEATVLPVNYAWHGGSVVFRTGRGTKLAAALMGQPLSFEIDDWETVEHSGWSVLVKGIGEEVTDAATIEELAALPVRPWAHPELRTSWVRILATEVTGRRIVKP